MIHSGSLQDTVSAETFEIDPFVLYPSNPMDNAGNPVASPTRNPSRPDREPFNEDNYDDPENQSGNPVDEDILDLPDSQRFPTNPAPAIPPRDYFNYDIQQTSLYGPGYPAFMRDENGFSVRYENNGWKFVQSPTHNNYWKEFSSSGYGAWNGALASRNMNLNTCGNVGLQSPIDIRLSGVACVEHHQIRNRPGDFRVSGEKVDKRIESNKLRLVWPRRPCPDLIDPLCAEPDPPHADFPNGWGGFADLMHIDFKIPGEHRIYGEVYDAEMQLFHLHSDRARLPAIAVPIRVDKYGFNPYLQIAIDAFQYEADLHRAQCANKVRNNRRLVSDFLLDIWGGNETLVEEHLDGFKDWDQYSTPLDDPEFLERGREQERKLSTGIWDPYHENLMPTYWFYGYDGSLTEPPCTEIVSWFVMDTPMLISPRQLDQMKMILFNHVDSNCRRTGVHFDGSVARPIQETGNRQVWRCTRDDFIPDAERNGGR